MRSSYFIVLQHLPGTLPVMNASALIRPEERRRRNGEGPAWAGTVPAWFRSEAFAEDLLEMPPPLPARPRQPPASGRDLTPAVAAQSER